MSYGDYVEQLTCLLFLKMADSDNQSAPGMIAQEIEEDLRGTVDPFKLVAADLTEDAIE